MKKYYFLIIIPAFVLLTILLLVIGNKTKPADSAADDFWQTYRNEKLGFEIKYPKTIYTSQAECPSAENNYQITGNQVPLKVYESEQAVYLAPAFLLKNLFVYKECQKISLSLDLMDQQLHWKIVIRDEIDNYESLQAFIRDFYGEKCQLGEKIPASQSGVFDIKVKNDGLPLDETDCPLNYATVMKYYPAQEKVIAWNLGQEYIFWSDAMATKTYDQEMVESFRFLE